MGIEWEFFLTIKVSRIITLGPERCIEENCVFIIYVFNFVETRRFTNSHGWTVSIPRGFSLEIEFRVAVRCYLLVHSSSRLISMSWSYVEIHKFQLFVRVLLHATNYNIFPFCTSWPRATMIVKWNHVNPRTTIKQRKRRIFWTV